MPGMFKFVRDDGGIVIMRFDRDYSIGADSKKKKYWQITFAELEAKLKNMSAQMDAAMQPMQRKLESLPPEQRKQIEPMMGAQPGGKNANGPLEVKKGGPSRTIAGLPTARCIGTEGGREVLVLWSTLEVPEFPAMRKDYEIRQKHVRHAPRRRQYASPRLDRSDEGSGRISDGKSVPRVQDDRDQAREKADAGKQFEPPAGYQKVPAPF